MATFTVDLPAHNAVIPAPNDLVTVVGGEGVETLASDDTDTYIRFDKSPSTTLGSTRAFRIGEGGASLGFGLWDKPAAATVTSVKFFTRVRLPFGGGGTIPDDGDGSYGGEIYQPGHTHFPIYRWPMVMVDYAGAPYTFGYNFSDIRTDGQWDDLLCDVDLQHLISGDDYVIAGIGSPDTGTFGLCPEVLVDPYYPDVTLPFTYNVAVDMAYLAIRITYEMATAPPPLRRYPRADGYGIGPTRHYPPPESRRGAGGYH